MATSKIPLERRPGIESEKLSATFHNNMGIGLYITGTLIPYLEIVRHAGTIFDRVMNGPSLGFVEIANGVGVLLAMGLAISGGKKMRASAKAEIAALDDLIGKPS